MWMELTAIWLWPLWALSWWLAARWADKATARPGVAAEAPYRILNVIGFFLLIAIVAQPANGHARLRSLIQLGAFGHGLWTTPPLVGWALVGVELAGFGFCWWARLHLGRLWSGWVTRKADHRVIDTGPYGLVRHPIYTGLLLAALATCLIKGSPAAMVGFVVLTYSLYLKARLEERFLRDQLGAPAYDAYAVRVPMLVPHPTAGRA
jgi:protein-S-isoprenylcysteine O-methyltransferase Ste14